jgi:nicotinamidase-related amidase
MPQPNLGPDIATSALVIVDMQNDFLHPDGGFSNSPLDSILRNMGVATYVVAGVTTCVCVSTTVRGGVEHNYRMTLVKDAVAEVHRDTHQAELTNVDPTGGIQTHATQG